MWHRNSGQPTSIMHDMSNYWHNIFTFSEEIFILCLQKVDLLCDIPMRIAEIPEADRSSETPIRFMMKQDKHDKSLKKRK